MPTGYPSAERHQELMGKYGWAFDEQIAREILERYALYYVGSKVSIARDDISDVTQFVQGVRIENA